MNRYKLAVALAVASWGSAVAVAGDREGGGTGAVVVQGQAQQQAVSVVGSSTSIDASTDVPRTAATAVAPAPASTDCAIMQQESKAFSVFFLSASGTTGTTFNELCYAFKRQQFEVADRLACMRSTSYALANPACKALLAAVAPAPTAGAAAERQVKWQLNQLAKAAGEPTQYDQRDWK